MEGRKTLVETKINQSCFNKYKRKMCVLISFMAETACWIIIYILKNKKLNNSSSSSHPGFPIEQINFEKKNFFKFKIERVMWLAIIYIILHHHYYYYYCVLFDRFNNLACDKFKRKKKHNISIIEEEEEEEEEKKNNFSFKIYN